MTDDRLEPVAGRMRVWEWGALLAILLVAGFLRFQEPGTVEYRRDEANLSRLALSMARGESVPLLGIGSSIGAPNPPFSVWVFVPPYLVGGNDPILATQWVGLLNVLAVLLLFLFARRWFGPGAAIVAASLFAVDPWAVIWSRKIWAQDVIPFFVLLTLGTGLLGFLERKRWAQGLFLPLLSITGQIYYATFVLIPAALYLIWVGRKHLGRPFWIGVGVTVLTVVPFAVGAIQAWNALPPGAAAEHLAKESEARHVALSGDVLLRLRDAWGGSGAAAFVGGEVQDLALDGAPDGEIFYEIVGVLALIGCAWMVCRAFRRGASKLDRMLALWVIATPLVYAFTWTTIWIHYMIPVLPLGFLALGVWTRDLGRDVLFRMGGPKPWISAGIAVLLALGTVQVWSQTSILRWVGEYHTPGGFGVPLGMRLKVRDDILSREPKRVLVFVEGDDVFEDGEAAVWDVLLTGLKDASVMNRTDEVFAAEPTVVLELPVTSGSGRVRRSDYFPMRHRHRDYPIHRSRWSRDPGHMVGVRAAGVPLDADYLPVDSQAFACGLRLVAFSWDEEYDVLKLVWQRETPLDPLAEGGLHVEAALRDAAGAEACALRSPLASVGSARQGDKIVWRRSCRGEPVMVAPHTIEVRLLKRPRLGERHWIGLKDDPDTNHVVLKLR